MTQRRVDNTDIDMEHDTLIRRTSYLNLSCLSAKWVLDQPCVLLHRSNCSTWLHQYIFSLESMYRVIRAHIYDTLCIAMARFIGAVLVKDISLYKGVPQYCLWFSEKVNLGIYI